jgi:transposase-like protein
MMNKQQASRLEINDFDTLIVYAKKRREKGGGLRIINNSKRYVRINFGKCRAVSLDQENPCGHLKKMIAGEEKEVGGRTGQKGFENAWDDAGNPAFFNHKPNNEKPEHKVQAFLVLQALSAANILSELLDCSEVFDNLFFVDDEYRVEGKNKGILRADVILLGKKNNCYFPVLIELKNKPETKVYTQLINSYAMAKEYETQFKAFLSAATGIPSESIDIYKAHLMAIWQNNGRSEKPPILQPNKCSTK